MSKILLIVTLTLSSVFGFGIPQKEEILTIDKLYKSLAKYRAEKKDYKNYGRIRKGENDQKMFCYMTGSDMSNCRKYLLLYPYGIYAKKISDRIEFYEKDEDIYKYSYSNKKALEKRYWTLVINHNAKVGYQMYIENFPNGKYIKVAKENLNNPMTNDKKTQQWINDRRKKQDIQAKKNKARDSEMTEEQLKHSKKLGSISKGWLKQKTIESLKYKKECDNDNGEACYKYAKTLNGVDMDERLELWLKACTLESWEGCDRMGRYYQGEYDWNKRNIRKSKVFFNKAGKFR